LLVILVQFGEHFFNGAKASLLDIAIAQCKYFQQRKRLLVFFICSSVPSLSDF
jgi:hypothetical protein